MAVASRLLQGATALVAAISQTQTNGGSDMGTFQAPKYPPFLTNNVRQTFNLTLSHTSNQDGMRIAMQKKSDWSPSTSILQAGNRNSSDLKQPIVNGWPWGSKSTSDSDPYTGPPNTGVVRYYEFTIARGTIAPDGYSKDMLLINGQYPGPPIEANWGDTIQVTVNNAISNPVEGTTIHYHGLNQQFSEWNDGVPAVSMCPISPGGSYTQTFMATPYGSSFYHSHFSSQYADGLWGPIVIHGPTNSPYDIDLGPITLNDYYHTPYFQILEGVMGPVQKTPAGLAAVRPASDNNLINGKMNFACPNANSNTTTGPCVNNAGLAKFNFQSGKKHRLRLINSGIGAIQKFSIDNHTMTVFANDFIPIEPYTTNIVTLGVGQRSDVVVEATGGPSDIVWMRSMMSSGECTEPANQPLALASIYYEHANETAAPGNNSIAHVDNTLPCENDALTKTIPAYPIAAGDPSTTIDMAVNVSINATGSLVWTINDSAFRGDYNNPILLLANKGNTSYPFNPDWNLYNVGTNTTIRVVVTNLSPTSHPWHLHGHEMSVLASGLGTWDGSIVNANNPQRRDVQIMPGLGYIVLQWQSDNPGVWPFHCHIAWHVSGGLYANILEQPDEIMKYNIDSAAFQNCRDWATFSGGTVVDQIDSGL